MKLYLLLAVTLGIALPALAGAEKVVVKSSRDATEHEEDEEESEEWDLEEEMYGPQVQRLEGINILDENLNVVLSDPSERVLRALGEPMETKNALTLEKVKALYREQVARKEKEGKKKIDYSNNEFEHMLAEEKKLAKEDAEEDDSIMQRVMDFIW